MSRNNNYSRNNEDGGRAYTGNNRRGSYNSRGGNNNYSRNDGDENGSGRNYSGNNRRGGYGSRSRGGNNRREGYDSGRNDNYRKNDGGHKKSNFKRDEAPPVEYKYGQSGRVINVELARFISSIARNIKANPQITYMELIGNVTKGFESDISLCVPTSDGTYTPDNTVCRQYGNKTHRSNMRKEDPNNLCVPMVEHPDGKSCVWFTYQMAGLAFLAFKKMHNSLTSECLNFIIPGSGIDTSRLHNFFDSHKKESDSVNESLKYYFPVFMGTFNTNKSGKTFIFEEHLLVFYKYLSDLVIHSSYSCELIKKIFEFCYSPFEALSGLRLGTESLQLHGDRFAINANISSVIIRIANLGASEECKEAAIDLLKYAYGTRVRHQRTLYSFASEYVCNDNINFLISVLNVLDEQKHNIFTGSSDANSKGLHLTFFNTLKIEQINGTMEEINGVMEQVGGLSDENKVMYLNTVKRICMNSVKSLLTRTLVKMAPERKNSLNNIQLIVKLYQMFGSEILGDIAYPFVESMFNVIFVKINVFYIFLDSFHRAVTGEKFSGTKNVDHETLGDLCSKGLFPGYKPIVDSSDYAEIIKAFINKILSAGSSINEVKVKCDEKNFEKVYLERFKLRSFIALYHAIDKLGISVLGVNTYTTCITSCVTNIYGIFDELVEKVRHFGALLGVYKNNNCELNLRTVLTRGAMEDEIEQLKSELLKISYNSELKFDKLDETIAAIKSGDKPKLFFLDAMLTYQCSSACSIFTTLLCEEEYGRYPDLLSVERLECTYNNGSKLNVKDKIWEVSDSLKMYSNAGSTRLVAIKFLFETE